MKVFHNYSQKPLRVKGGRIIPKMGDMYLNDSGEVIDPVEMQNEVIQAQNKKLNELQSAVAKNADFELPDDLVHATDISGFATKDELKDFLTKTDASSTYAKASHSHSSYLAKSAISWNSSTKVLTINN